MGPVLIVAVVCLVAALVRRTRADLVLASFVLVYFADLLTLRAHFDRSVLPLVPPLAALAGRFRSIVPVTLMLLVVPLVWAVRADQKLTREDTRVIALRWIEGHVPQGTKLVLDTGLPQPRGFRVVRLKLPGPGAGSTSTACSRTCASTAPPRSSSTARLRTRCWPRAIATGERRASTNI